MRKVWTIVENTFIEVIRDRILYGLVVFAILLIGLSLALGQLSFSEQNRIAIDFGMVGVQLSSVILAIFIGSTLVSKEIEKQTILTILSRSISRPQFLIGKFFGLLCVVITIQIGLSLILFMISFLQQAPLGLSFLIALWGILLESVVLLGITMLMGVIVRPVLTVACTLGLFLIGHWIPSLMFFTSKSENTSFRTLGKILSAILPNLEKFNWRYLVIYEEPLPWAQIGTSSLYALGWILILTAITNLIFRRKDFV